MKAAEVIGIALVCVVVVLLLLGIWFDYEDGDDWP